MSEPRWLTELHRIGALRGFLLRVRELCHATFVLGMLYAFDTSLGWVGPVIFMAGYLIAFYRAITLLSEADALISQIYRDEIKAKARGDGK